MAESATGTQEVTELARKRPDPNARILTPDDPPGAAISLDRVPVRAVERVVHSSERVEVGAFRCPPEHPDFRHAGQIRDHCAFVFPRTSVWIRHEGRPPFATTSAVVTLYNPHQPYTRERLDPRGDLCEWFAVDPETAAEAAGALDATTARRRQPFRFTHGPADAETYLRQRELFQRLSRGGPVDELDVEEQVLALLRRVLEMAYGAWEAGFLPPRDEPDGREREAARQALVVLGQRFRDPLTVADVAAAVGLSRFRLCHVFRRVTGTTLHAQREQLRLRAALDALGDGCRDLTGLALDLGYSSHSHFTASFRRTFGLTPSAARARLVGLRG